jgi:uncharacterized OB-fold protein
VEGLYSHADDIIDVWRRDSDCFVRSWEDRFILAEGYTRNMREAASQIMTRHGLAPKDFAKAVLYGPNPRSLTGLARTLGFDPDQVQDPMFDKLGNTGAAFALIMLVAALEDAKGGDRILLMNYGDGSDAIVLRVNEEINRMRGHGIKRQLDSKRALPQYGKYIRDRELLTVETERARPALTSSPSLLWRDRDMTTSFCGSKCNSCGHTHFPPERVCLYCKAKDDFELVALSRRKGTLAAFSLDSLAASLDPPTVVSAVNLEGDVRVYCYMTDRDPDKVEVGMPLEMTFRKMHEAGGYPNYFWKCGPPR